MSEGVITRNSDGTKSTPSFLGGWREKALENHYLPTHFSPYRPYLLVTGKESGVVAIDCDNKITADIILSLAGIPFDKLEGSPWVIFPKGKEGVTLLYQYEEDLHSSMAQKSAPIELDFLSTGKGMFMPTHANETKISWEEDNIVRENLQLMPSILKEYLLNFISRKQVVAEDTNTPPAEGGGQSIVYPSLHPLVDYSVEADMLYKPLLKILTPRKTRQEMSVLFNKKGYIAPSDIQKGGGSSYLLAISTILGGDMSINASLYQNAIKLFNSGLQTPLEQSRLEDTILKPMLNKKSMVDGEVIWRYNKNWRGSGFTLIDKNKNLLYILTDSISYSNVIVNMTDKTLSREDKSTPCAATLRMITGQPIKPAIIEERAVLTEVRVDLGKSFGIQPDNSFNTFRESEFLSIMRDPEIFTDKHQEDPQKPVALLDFLEHLIPDEASRIFFIRFLATKLGTFSFSPIIFNFTGMPGSGKDTLFRLMQIMVNPEYTSKPSPDQVLSRFNEAWAENKLFVLCNEFPDSLPPSSYGAMKGKLKEFSGSSEFVCEEKNKSLRSATHSITFIMAQNSSAPLADPGDRRHMYIKTPVALIDWGGLRAYESAPGAGDEMEIFQALLVSELPAFAYYLKEKVTPLSSKEYITPPVMHDATGNKYEQVDDKAYRLGMVLKDRNWEYLLDVMHTMDHYEVTSDDIYFMKDKGYMPLDLAKEIINHWGYSVSTNQLNHVMLEMIGNKALRRMMGGRKTYCFRVPGIKGIDTGSFDVDFEDNDVAEIPNFDV